jgi:hypothetical protein
VGSAQLVEGQRPSSAEPQGKLQRRWVWHATEQTAEARTVSALAIVETLAAMATYSWIAWRFGTLHLTLAACVVPFLLLRTEYSTALGLQYYEKLSSRMRDRSQLLLGAILLLLLFIWRAQPFLAEQLPTFDRAISLMIVSFASVAVIIALPDALWALGCRVLATIVGLVSAPRDAVESVPRNWWRLMGCTDMFVPPHLLPGPKSRSAALELRPFSLWTDGVKFGFSGLDKGRAGWSAIILRCSRPVLIVVYVILFSMLAIALALPAWLYRWSIKGTSVVWAPLALLVWESPRTRPEHISESKVALGASVGALTIVATALGAALKHLLGTDFGLLMGYEHLAAAAAKHKAAAAFFPVTGVPAWQWVALVGAIAVLAGYFYALRLKSRGWTEPQKRRVDLAYHVLGLLAVALIFSWIYTAASVADWRPLFGG